MVMIFFLVIIMIFSLFHYKKAVFLCASSLLFMPNLVSGIPGVKMLYIICIFQIVLFYFKGYNKRASERYPRVLLIPSILTFIGYLFSNYFGISKNLPIILVNCLCYFYYPYIVWYLLDSKESVRLFLKYLVSFFLIVAVYALIELAIGRNVVAEFFMSQGITENLSSVEDARFGLLRCNSILPYSSALGMLSALVFFILLNVKALTIKQDNVKVNILLLLLPFCVLLSGTRSQFGVFAICLIPIFFWKEFLRTTTAKILLIVGIVVLIMFSGLFDEIVSSIFYSDNSQVEGSSVKLRQTQLAICLKYYAQNPIFGNGRNYIWEYVRPHNPMLMGAESVWFQLMVDYGIVGCINYLLVILGSIITLYKKSIVLCFLPIAFLFGKTISIVIGVELSTLLIFTILLFKLYSYYDDH